MNIICFAGAAYRQQTWTNRQHIMSRVAVRHRVLYIEPRIWLVRYCFEHWRRPGMILSLLRRIVWYERVSDKLLIKAQWNLLPGSREVKVIAVLNHLLNRYGVLLTTWWLGFNRDQQVMWVYDTEAAEYLSAFKRATVLYDCVDDHAAQAGPNRNPQRVQEEERFLLRRADVVTVTSRRLLELKKPYNQHVHLVLNAGDVSGYSKQIGDVPPELRSIARPILGSVGALDAYKYDFAMLSELAKQRPDWSFVLIGAPVVDQKSNKQEAAALAELPNVHYLGPRTRGEVVAYVQAFDVCLIPYRDNRYNAASFPLKFWEFMATGRPVVVSGLPELKQYSSLIGYAESVDQFIRFANVSLQHPERGQKERITLARQHSWEKRVEKLLELVGDGAL